MINPNKKPLPLYDGPVRPACPVCGHTSYSCGGIHPQCAMLAEDKVRTERMKAHRLEVPAPSEVLCSLRRHEKRCPKCQKVHPLRRYKCECGHTFFQLKKSS